MYLASGNVIVFPAANRSNNQRAVYTSEVNLTGILNSLSDQDSFLIRAEFSEGSTTKFGIIECVIHGYYFNLTDVDFSELSNGDIYFNIKLNNITNFPSLTSFESGALDDDVNFNGLSISNSPPENGTDYTYYSLYFGVKDNDGIKINDSAYFKFDIKSLYFNNGSKDINFPKITSEKYSVGNNTEPENPKKGDIWILY